MNRSLLLKRRFAPLFWCQFFSAFSDNFLKNALVFLVLFQLGGENAASLVALAAAVFIAPFFFLSALGGQLADRYDKAIMAQWVKLAEIGVAFIAVAGFLLQSAPVLFVALFLFGVVAALFSPIKYGILPDHLARSELPAGNALIEGATFIAILLGTIAGGLAAKGGGHPLLFSALIIVFALMCWGSSLLIPRSGRGAPDLVVRWNIAASTVELIRYLHSERQLWWGGLVVSWFWLAGAVTLSLMPPLVKDKLGGAEEVVTLALAAFSIAIAVGSGLASWLARGRIVLLPTLIGAVLLGVFAVDIGLATLALPRLEHTAGIPEALGTAVGVHTILDLCGMAIAAGLYVVPTFAAMQAWAHADRRARVVAAVNVLSAAFMVVGALVVAALQAWGLTTSDLFAWLGGACLLVAIAIARTMPANARDDFRSIMSRFGGGKVAPGETGSGS